MSLKLKYNITAWPLRKVNYWGIPKCGNTAIKYALMKPNIQRIVTNPNDANDWIHSEGLAEYITPEIAMSNGFVNFTVIRDPILRTISTYNDFFDKRKGRFHYDSSVITFENFVDYLLKVDDSEQTDIHFRSQISFIRPCIKTILIGKLERIDEFFKMFVPPVELQIMHVTEGPIYPENVHSAVSDKILRRYNEDYMLYKNILKREDFIH